MSLLPTHLTQAQKGFSASPLPHFQQPLRQGKSPAEATCLLCLPSEQGARGAAPEGSGLAQLDESLMVLQGNASCHS